MFFLLIVEIRKKNYTGPSKYLEKNYIRFFLANTAIQHIFSFVPNLCLLAHNIIFCINFACINFRCNSSQYLKDL